ncbi:MAG: hypothetical protein LBK61_07350, partial [Spirochaetaceae bacterium]|nr:hypothetical protein [Spirochaetaceae bacterium]
MPLRGAKTQPGFHPFANHFRLESYPDSGRGISGRQAEYPLMAEGPCRGRKPAGFSSLYETYPRCETYPQFWSKEQRQAGRIPSCGGCASPSGAQCRRMTVFCLP